MINAIFEYNYMQNATLAAIFTSIMCALIGTIIVEKKWVNLSGGIAHASFGGIGLGYLLGIEPIFGGLFFAISASLGVKQIKKQTNMETNTIINMFWAAGMALGILFISLTEGYPPDMTSYFFGDILTVSNTYLAVMLILTFIVLLAVILLFQHWKLFLFDEEYAKVIGINVNFLETLLYLLIALSIVVLIKVVGIILAIAMLTVPPSIARMLTINLKRMIILSLILGILISFSGLTLSYYLNLPSGATIIILAIVCYFITLIYSKSRAKN